MKFTSLFEKESRRKIGDLCLNIGATALLNIVIQFALYPYLQHKLGDNTYGVTLALLSLVAITSGPCGNAANYSRLVSEKIFILRMETTIYFCCSADYFALLLEFSTYGGYKP